MPKPAAGGETAAAAPAAAPSAPAAAASPAAAAPAAAATDGAGSKPSSRTPSRGKGAGKSPASGAKSPASAAKPKAASKVSAAGKSTKPAARSKSSKPAAAPATLPAKRKKADKAVKEEADAEDSDSWDADEGPEGSFQVNLISSDEEQEEKAQAAVHKRARKVAKLEEKKEEKEPAAKKAAPPAAKRRPKQSLTSPSGKKLPAALQRIADNPGAMEAVQAVDAAAEELPPFNEETVKFMAETMYGGGRAPDEPPQRGIKEAPHGHEDCLTGKTFVITGIMDSLTRTETEDFIKRHGGKLTGDVSGKTSFLLVGAYAGRSKYYRGKEKGVRCITEDDLFALVRAAPAAEGMEVEEAPEAIETSDEVVEVQREQPGASQQQQQQQQAAKSPGGAASGAGLKAKSFYGAKGSGPRSPAAEAGAAAALARASGSTLPSKHAAPAGRHEPAADQQLWVEKWRPKTSAELVGNQTIVNTLRQWLKDWEKVHLHGSEPGKPPGKSTKQQGADMKKKAVLLTGPPGIGKTSAAIIMCRELGYEPVEVNASDSRGKADASVLKGVGGKLANAVKELSTNTAISYTKDGQRKKLCLVMDEVDGMSAGDRGGVADLIQTIHKTRVPIIAIANDKFSTKLRSLRNHCLELDFRKPMVAQISKRMLEICRAEGLSMNQATMDALVQSANGGDIRLIVGQLQMIRRRSRALSYDQVKSGGMATAKDLEMSPFEAARRLLSVDGEALSLGDQIDLVFQDLDLVPLLVQENYVNHRPRLAKDDAQRLRIMAKAADAISAGDLATRVVRQQNNWTMAPFAAAMGTVYPATYMRGFREQFSAHEPNFPRFTAWLGQNSSFGKQKRLLGELHTRMLSSGGIECDRSGLRLSYLPVLRSTLTQPLASQGKGGIEAVLQLMRAYCISREDIDFITDVTKFKTREGWGEDPMKGIATADKAAFTRAFNQQHIKPRTGFGMDDKLNKKKGGGAKGRKAARPADDDEDAFGEEGLGAEGAGPSAQQAEEEDEDELDPVKLQKTLKSMKHKGMTLTLKDGTSAAKPSKATRKPAASKASGSKPAPKSRAKK